MNIGQRIREVREDLGMQAAVLARRVGVAPNTIYRIEVGDRTPSVALLEKIARELRTEPADLFKEPVHLDEAPREAGRPSVIDVALDAARRQIALEKQAMFGGRSEPIPILDQHHVNEAMQRLREEYGLEGNDAEAVVDFVLKAARLQEENATLRDRLQEREQAHS
jgi:transcriptional regulator with XRE-family HTH domain